MGVIVALVVDDIDAELVRLTAEGVEITLPLREQEWGERLFQATESQRHRGGVRAVGQARERRGRLDG